MIDNRAYHNLHYWVRRELGTPSECENCGTTDPQFKYEWANLSGEYLQDTSDWARLCKLCHNLIDHSYHRPTYCGRDHALTPENTKINENHNRNRVYVSRNCKMCLRENANAPQQVERRRHYRHLKASKIFNNCERCIA